MSIAFGVEVTIAEQDGRPVVHKRAVGEPGTEHLAREAQRLEVARHPGVVATLAHEPGELTLAWAGDRTLETHRPSFEEAAALLVAIAQTVADLHDVGLVHGRLTPDHVVIDGQGRPRLCGMSGVGPEEEQPGPTDDVIALGRLIDALIGGGAETEPIPERRWSRRRWTGYQRRSLQNLADQATDPDSSHRPTARDLAAALATAVPTAHLVVPGVADSEATPEQSATPWMCHALDPAEDCRPVPDDDEFAAAELFLGMRVADDSAGKPITSPDRHRRHLGGAEADAPDASTDPPSRPTGRLVVTTAALILLAALAALAMRPPSSPSNDAAQSSGSSVTPVPATSHPAGSPAPTSATQAPLAPDRADCPAVASPSADVDGDQCPDPIVVAGSTIQAGAVRYRLGDDGDDVVVGDWDCDGQATPALVRPSTGEVFVFARWATAAEPMSVGPTAVVDIGASPLPVSECGPLQVRVRSGAVTTVPVASTVRAATP